MWCAVMWCVVCVTVAMHIRIRNACTQAAGRQTAYGPVQPTDNAQEMNWWAKSVHISVCMNRIHFKCYRWRFTIRLPHARHGYLWKSKTKGVSRSVWPFHRCRIRLSICQNLTNVSNKRWRQRRRDKWSNQSIGRAIVVGLLWIDNVKSVSQEHRGSPWYEPTHFWGNPKAFWLCTWTSTA